MSPVLKRQQFSNALISPLNSQYSPHGGNFPPVKNPCCRVRVEGTLLGPSSNGRHVINILGSIRPSTLRVCRQEDRNFQDTVRFVCKLPESRVLKSVMLGREEEWGWEGA